MRDSFTMILEEAFDAPFIFGESGRLEVCTWPFPEPPKGSELPPTVVANRAARTGR